MKILAKHDMELPLGKQGMNEATVIRFPIEHLTDEFGRGGSFQLLHQRSKDKAPYPCQITEDQFFVYWAVTEQDAQYAGIGKAELQYRREGVTFKSLTWRTRTEAGLGEATEAPELQRGWVDELLDAAAGIEGQSKAAKTAAIEAGKRKNETERVAEEAGKEIGKAQDKALQTIEEKKKSAIDEFNDATGETAAKLREYTFYVTVSREDGNTAELSGPTWDIIEELQLAGYTNLWLSDSGKKAKINRENNGLQDYYRAVWQDINAGFVMEWEWKFSRTAATRTKTTISPEKTENRTQHITDKSTDEQYPTAAAVRRAIAEYDKSTYVFNVTSGIGDTAAITAPTYDAVRAKFQEGFKNVFIRQGSYEARLTRITASGGDQYRAVYDMTSANGATIFTWLFTPTSCTRTQVYLAPELRSNRVTSLETEPAGTQYPSAGAVYEALQKKANKEEAPFIAIYGQTTFQEIAEAYAANKSITCIWDDQVKGNKRSYDFCYVTNTQAYFSLVYANRHYIVTCNKGVTENNGWRDDSYITLQQIASLVKTISASSTDSNAPSAKAVYDFVKPVADDIENQGRTLTNHENRIQELEQGGGGGGTVDTVARQEIGKINDFIRPLDYELGSVNPTSKLVKAIRANTSSTVESPTGTRLRILYIVSAGDIVDIESNSDYGIYVGIYDTENKAIYANSDRIEDVTGNNYVKDHIHHEVGVSGYLSISMRTMSGGAISDAEMLALLNGLQVYIIPKKSDGLLKLKMIETAVNRGEINNSVIAVLANGTLANPANAVAVHMDNYLLVSAGSTAFCHVSKPLAANAQYYSYGYQTYDKDKNLVRNLNYSSATRDNFVVINEGERYIRFNIAEYSSSLGTLTRRVSDFDRYPVVAECKLSAADAIGELYSATYESTANADMRGAIASAAAVNHFVSGNYASLTAKKGNFTFAAITDLHGSAEPLSEFVGFCNSEKDYIDAAICLGDTVQVQPSENTEWLDSAISLSEIPFYYVVGNHDTADTARSGITQAQTRSKYFQTIETKGWLAASNFMANGKSSWYKDFDDYKIRIIALFEYDNSASVAASAPNTYCRRWLNTDTLQWFADTLYSTPTDYHAIVLLHQFPYYPIDYVDCSFSQSERFRKLSSDSFLNTVNGNPIEEIVNAYIHGSAISKTYSDYFGMSKTASVSKDFSNRGNGAFVGYFVGHLHQHYVFKSKAFPEQKTIGIPSGSTNLYQRHWDDTPYDAKCRNRNNFYVIGIDTDNRSINLVKIGGQDTLDMRKRTTESIPY